MDVLNAVVNSLKGTVLMAFDICHRQQVVTYLVGQVIDVDDGMFRAIKGCDKPVIAWDGEPAPDTATLLEHIRAFRGM